jgi:hypothetical protein
MEIMVGTREYGIRYSSLIDLDFEKKDILYKQGIAWCLEKLRMNYNYEYEQWSGRVLSN